jgi:hypothetical protein
MAAKRKIEEVLASPVVRLTDSPAVVAVLADFHDKWNEDKWAQVFSSLSDKESEEMRGHFKKKKLMQSSFELLKRLPAYRELAEMEIRFGEVLRHAKSRMEEELFDQFSKGKHFKTDAVLELLDKCKPPPPVVEALPLFPGSQFGSLFGSVVPPPPPCSYTGSPVGQVLAPAPPGSVHQPRLMQLDRVEFPGSSGDVPYAIPPGSSNFGSVDLPVELPGPPAYMEMTGALELAMASAAEPSDDEDL